VNVEQTLLKEVEDSKKWYNRTRNDNTYKRDLKKTIELLNWVLEEMKNPDIFICQVIENKMNELIDEINKKDSIIEADPLDIELRILDWILYAVCSNEIKKL
jgi:hypothetical protein